MRILLITLSLLSLPVNAGLWPVITGIETEVTGISSSCFAIGVDTSKGAICGNYKLTWSYLDLPGADEKNNGDPIISYSVVKKLGRSDVFTPIYIINSIARNDVSIADSWGQFYAKDRVLKDTIPFVYQGTVIPNECYGFAWGPEYKTGSTTAFYFTLKTYGGCIKPPPIQHWCSIVSPALMLDHGTVVLADISSSVASATLQVECTGASDATLRLADDSDSINLTPAGKAKISIDGKPPGSAFSLSAGINSFTVTDSLSGINKAASYYGSTVLILEPI
jgi:hypothetical protein